MSNNRENYLKRKKDEPPRQKHISSAALKAAHANKGARRTSAARTNNRKADKKTVPIRKLPVCIGLLSIISLIVGIVFLLQSSSSQSKESDPPKLTPAEAIEWQTFTFESGLVTMGLKTEEELEQEKEAGVEILIPPKGDELPQKDDDSSEDKSSEEE